MGVKDISVKNQKYYFLNDITYIENFDLNNIKIDENSYKNILVYYIGYTTINKDQKINSVNRLYIIFYKVKRYFEEIKGNKHLTLVRTNTSEEKIKKRIKNYGLKPQT